MFGAACRFCVNQDFPEGWTSCMRLLSLVSRLFQGVEMKTIQNPTCLGRASAFAQSYAEQGGITALWAVKGGVAQKPSAAVTKLVHAGR